MTNELIVLNQLLWKTGTPMKSLQHDFHWLEHDTANNLELVLGHFHLGLLALVWSSPTVTATVNYQQLGTGASAQAQSGYALPRNHLLVTRPTRPSLVLREGSWHET